jgi:hypothetical protein
MACRVRVRSLNHCDVTDPNACEWRTVARAKVELACRVRVRSLNHCDVTGPNACEWRTVARAKDLPKGTTRVRLHLANASGRGRVKLSRLRLVAAKDDKDDKDDDDDEDDAEGAKPGGGSVFAVAGKRKHSAVAVNENAGSVMSDKASTKEDDLEILFS